VVGEMSGVGDGMVMVMMMRKTGHSDMDYVMGVPKRRGSAAVRVVSCAGISFGMSNDLISIPLFQ